MIGLSRIVSFAISSFRAILYPLEIVFGSIFSAFRTRLGRPSDTEALGTCPAATLKIVSAVYLGGFQKLLAD